MTLTEYIQNHPVIAFILTGTHVLAAEVLSVASIPEIIMQCFQLGAWSITMVVGLITIRGAVKKWKRK